MKKIALYLWMVIIFAVIQLHCSAQCKENSLSSDSIKFPAGNCYVYIPLDTAQSIVIYKMDSGNGSLHFVNEVQVGGSTGALAVDPTHRYLYAAIRSKNSISSFRIDTNSGNLSFLNTICAAGNPVYLSTDRMGKYLLSAYFADSKVAVYEIGNDGMLRDSALQSFATEKNAHAIQTDWSNKYVLIPCRTGETIHQFKFDPADGSLAPNMPDRVRTDSLTGPRHFVFHSQLDVVYFSNEFSSTVTAYHFDTSNGTLSAFQSLSMLPKDFAGINKAADIHLTPDNRFLYASNRGHESIAGYSIDSVTGRMTSIGNFATEKSPREFDIDPQGKFLYAGGQSSGRIAAYCIDKRTGWLTLLNTYEVGRYPAWVLIVQIDNNNK